jgi:hypothetical protein
MYQSHEHVLNRNRIFSRYTKVMKHVLNRNIIFNRCTKVFKVLRNNNGIFNMKHVLNRNSIFNRCTQVTKHGLNISVSSFHDSLESEVNTPLTLLSSWLDKLKRKQREKEKDICFERLDYKIFPLSVSQLFNLETLITFSNCKTLTLQIAFFNQFFSHI